MLGQNEATVCSLTPRLHSLAVSRFSPSPLRRRILSVALTSPFLLSSPSQALDLDPLPPSFLSSPYYPQTLKVVASLQETLKLLDDRNKQDVSDSEVREERSALPSAEARRV